MNADEILRVLDSLAKYIVYIYPGYITIYLYRFFRAKCADGNKEIVFKSIAISFLYKLVLDKTLSETEITYHFWMIVISVIVPYIAYQAQKSIVVQSILEILGINTRFEENEIEILDNGKYSAWVKVYLKEDNIVYEGFLGETEMESGKRQFIILKKYRKYILNKSGHPKPYIEEHEHDEDKVLIFYDDVKRIEKNVIGQQDK